MENKIIEHCNNFTLLHEEVLEKNIAIKITTKSGTTVLVSEKIWNKYNDLVSQINFSDFKDNTYINNISNDLQSFTKNNTKLKEVYFED